MAEKSLITFEQISAVDIFVEGKYKDVIEEVKKLSTIENPTAETGAGRKLIRSVAAKIASSKTFLEKAGKDLSDKKKAEIAKDVEKIQTARNEVKTALSDWKDKVRKPLTDYENKIKEVEEAERVRLEAEKQAIEDKKVADFEAEKDRLAEGKADLEKEKVRLAAEETARNKLQNQENTRLVEAKQKEKNAKISVGNARKTLLDVFGVTMDFQVIMDMDQAVWDDFYLVKNEEYQTEKTRLKGISDQKIKDDAEAEAKQKSDKVESDRLEKERLEKVAADKKAADIGHRQKINNEVLADLLPILEKLNEAEPDEPFSFTDAAKEITKAIIRKQIRNVSINY